jgi:hypothetical protein
MRGATAPAALLAAVLLGLAPAPAAAQDRPSEDELFGAPPAAPGAAAAPRDAPAERDAPAQGGVAPDEAELFGASGSPAAVPPPPERLTGSGRDDPLQLGGQLYLRAQLSAQDDTKPGDSGVSSPNLLDLFVDVRPNERVRGFALGRLSYDAVTADGRVGLPPELAAALGLEPASNPRAVLDQLWVNFDVGRRLFVTAGRQHAKWGVGRFWNPTDFLHRQPRDPLDVFDARTGTAMVKLHAPWEARGWNAYGVVLLEDPRAGGGEAAGTLRGLPAGGRVEVVLGTMELGADLLVGEGARPRYGVDVSAGIWELDLYAEAAFGAARPRWRERDPAAPILTAPGVPGRYELRPARGGSPQVVAGGSWSVNYSDEDALTAGAEYFYQESGYDDPRVYPFLLFGAPSVELGPPLIVARQDPAAFTSFYLGRHYAGAFLLLPQPGRWNDTSLTLSVLGNLSDKSFVARLDHSVLALTYLRVETFVAGHLGKRGSEFRFALDLPPEISGALGAERFGIEAPIVDVGIALRVNL